jgi:hypothetical protein
MRLSSLLNCQLVQNLFLHLIHCEAMNHVHYFSNELNVLQRTHPVHYESNERDELLL